MDASTSTAPDPRRWIGLFAALVAPFLGVVDFFVLNLALPEIGRDLGASFAELELAIALYGLGNAVFVVTGGRLGDAHGRRRTFLFGTSCFIATSVLVAVSPTSWFLLGARFLQGVSAAILFPQVLALVTVLFPDHERPRAFAYFGLTVATASIVGVVLGGALLRLDPFGLGWRSLFLINLPIGLAGFLVAKRTLHEVRSANPPRLDPLGVLIATLALASVLVPLTIGHERGWPAWARVTLCLAGPCVLLFVAAERATARRGGDPLVDPSLFRLAGYRRGLFVVASYFLGAGSLFLVLSLFEQRGLGRDPLRAALTFVPSGVATFAASFLATGNADRRPALFLHGGLALVLCGLALLVGGLSFLDGPADASFGSPRDLCLAAGLALYGFGNGAISPVLYSTILRGVPARSAGSAAGVLATVQQVAAATGVAVIGLVFATLLGARTSADDYAHAAAWALGVNLASMVAATLLALRLPRREPSSRAADGSPAEPA